jgi:uncharacterized protein YkwD
MQPSLTKSTSIHNKVVIAILVLTILALIQHSQIQGVQTTMTPSEIISVTNATRQTYGLSPLHPQPQLMKAAEAKAQAMITANTWSHNTPTETPWQFIQGEGYTYVLAGENLAKGFDTAEAVVDAWINSPSHKENLLNSEYSETGVAVIEATFQNKDQTTLVVQFLAKAADPQNNDLPVTTQAPLLINSFNGIKMTILLFSFSIAIIVLLLIILLKLNMLHHKRIKHPPNTSFWKQ